jgi:hypothetical protein
MSTLHCAHVQNYVRKPGPFAFFHSPDVDPILSASYPQCSQRWRKGMRAFDGSELDRQLLPPWVEDLLMNGRCMVPTTVQKKKGFTIEADEHSRLPARRKERLTAPVILEVRKVTNYIEAKLVEAGYNVVAAEITFDPEENWRLAQASPGPHIAVTHKGALLPSCLSLNTVKRYLDDGKDDDDLRLQYLLVDWRLPPPIADVIPKEISVD